MRLHNVQYFDGEERKYLKCSYSDANLNIMNGLLPFSLKTKYQSLKL